MTLLEEARRDIPLALTKNMRERYYGGIGLVERRSFKEWHGVIGAQRHAKVAGFFVRLFRRDGKAQYLKNIPRVVKLLARHLDMPKLLPVREWYDEYLPDFMQPLLSPAEQDE